jgi:hypothetical protein
MFAAAHASRCLMRVKPLLLCASLAVPVLALAKTPPPTPLPPQDLMVDIRQVDEGARGGKSYGTASAHEPMPAQQLQVRNGERASLRISSNTPMQWARSVSAQEGKVKQAITWLESGQTITVTPTWHGGKQPVAVVVDVQTAHVTTGSANSTGPALPQQERAQWATTVSAPLGEWVTLATSGQRTQRSSYSSEAASETRLTLELRVTVR